MTLLKGNKIQLRALEPEDIEVLFDTENNPVFWGVSNTIQPFSKQVLINYISQAHLDIFTTKQVRFVVDYNNKFAGMIDLFDFDPQHRRAGIGILILPEFQNLGFASEALQLIIEYGFTILQLHQLYATITTDNKKSIRLFQKQGFTINGTQKDWIYHNGTYKDEHILQLLHNK